MTQKESVYKMLEDNGWVCGSQFLDAYLPEYRSRLNEIGKDKLISRRCTRHKHRGGMLDWHLKQESAPGEAKPTNPDICATCHFFTNHSPICPQRQRVKINQMLL